MSLFQITDTIIMLKLNILDFCGLIQEFQDVIQRQIIKAMPLIDSAK